MNASPGLVLYRLIIGALLLASLSMPSSLANAQEDDVAAETEEVSEGGMPEEVAPGTFRDANLEAAVRAQLGRPDGELGTDALASVTVLNARGRDIRDLTGLTALVGLTELDLTDNPNLDTTPLPPTLDALPALVQLDIDATPTPPRPPVPVPAEGDRTATLPYRIRTAHAVLLGDSGITMRRIWGYARAFEATIVPEEITDTGLAPAERKVLIQLYGSEAVWNAEMARLAQPATRFGFFWPATQRLYMAHWRSTPTSFNTVLLAHEYFHWLARTEGRAGDMPVWFNEGLAFNISWRIQERASGWSPQFARQVGWWDQVARATTPVPNLATYRNEDTYVETAVAHLMEMKGRDALIQFFRLTRSGQRFAPAFQGAFGQTTDAFQRDYEARVARLRATPR